MGQATWPPLLHLPAAAVWPWHSTYMQVCFLHRLHIGFLSHVPFLAGVTLLGFPFHGGV